MTFVERANCITLGDNREPIQSTCSSHHFENCVNDGYADFPIEGIDLQPLMDLAKKCQSKPIFLSQVRVRFPKYFDALDKMGKIDIIWNNRHKPPTPNHTPTSSDQSQ